MAEQEFRHELIRGIVHEIKYSFVEFVKNIYNDALNENKSNRFILRDFQNALKEVSTWSELDKKQFVTDYIKDTVGISKILGDFTEINRKLGKELGTISLHGFLYSCALNTARECWTKPFLFYHRVDKTEYQKNMIAIEKLVGNEIKSTIRGLPSIVEPEPLPSIIPEPEPLPSIVSEPEVEEPEIESESEPDMEFSEEKEIELPKSHRKFKANSLQAYGNYLNPLVFKPPFMRHRKQKKV